MKNRFDTKGVVHSRYTSAGSKIRGHKKKMSLRAKIVLTVVLSLAAALVGALVIGNLLGNRAEKAESYFDRVEQLKLSAELNILPSKKVDARAFTLGSSLSSIPEGVDSLAIELGREDGSLCFDSAVAESFGKPDSDGVDLGVNISALKSAGKYVVGYLYSSFLGVSNIALGDALAAYERAVIHEAAECGIDEILIFTGDVGDNKDARLRSYLKLVKTENPELCVGVTVGVSDIADESGWTNISSLGTVCDYAALDLREVSFAPESEIAGSEAEFVARARFYLDKYSTRLVLSGENDESLAFVEKYRLDNRMVI